MSFRNGYCAKRIHRNTLDKIKTRFNKIKKINANKVELKYSDVLLKLIRTISY